MAKNYTEELAEWVKRREASKPRQDRNAVAFLAVRTDVQAAMDAGYSRKTIWEHLRETGKVSCRYETFLRLVQRHLKRRLVTQATPPVPEKPSSPAAKKSPPPAAGSFTFDPKPNKEELI